MNQSTAKWGVLAMAVLTLIYNLSDAVADLQNFHGDAVWSPAFVAVIMRQIGTVGIAALSGHMMTKESK